ncbi:MAG: glycosyltransferase family 4 protein [Chitinophagales bacterium]|nr:glycosyltransferase family 4 protein [Chitinophagales bacterium]MCZ2393860.1 glycosyltransferase family 4 protein [Chitinophagales bacterium]
MVGKIRNIIHLSSADIWRGAEQQIIYLYQGLKEKGYHQTIFCSKNGKLYQYCLDNHIPHIAYQKESGLNIQLAWLIRKANQEKLADIFHIHDPHAHHAYISAYISGVSIPAILHRRNDFPTAQNIFSASKYSIKGIVKIICVSQRVKNIFKNKNKLFQKSEVLYDSVDIEKFQKIGGRNILEREFPILNHQFIIANIAALVDHKDIPTYLKAVHYLIKTLGEKNIKALIIGSGEKHDEIKQLIQAYHLENDVIILGHRKDIANILNGIDIYTFTSKMEGFGSTILEVMSARVPIVATNTGGPAEILEHRKTALISNIGDYISIAQNISELKNNVSLRQSICNQAFEKVQKFSIENYIEQIEKVYLSL